MLVPCDYICPVDQVSKEASFAYKKENNMQVEWHIKPVWVLEIYVNDPDYPVSLRRLYLEKQRITTYGHTSESYDLAGRLWKGQTVFINVIHGPSMENWGTVGGRYDNFLTGHSTMLMAMHRSGDPSVSPKLFTFKETLKIAK